MSNESTEYTNALIAQQQFTIESLACDNEDIRDEIKEISFENLLHIKQLVDEGHLNKKIHQTYLI